MLTKHTLVLADPPSDQRILSLTMSRAIVFAAGGLIGYHVARALVADGWVVTGVVRSQFDAQQLLLVGATPLVISSLEADEAAFTPALADATLVVDGGLPRHYPPKLLALAVKHTRDGAKKRVIITSGGAIYSSRGDTPVDESSPLNPHPAFEDARALLHDISSRQDVIATVIAPSGVYGAWFSSWSILFDYNQETKKVDFPGSPAKRIGGFHHVYDVADAYVIVARADAGSVAGQSFLLSSDQRTTLLDLWRTLAVAAGSSGEINFVPPWTQGYLPFLENLDTVIDASKIKRLGWRAKHTAVSKDEAARLYASYTAWKAVRAARPTEAR